MIRQLASDLRQRSLESPHISMQYTCNWAIDRYSRGKVPPVNENNCSGVYFSLCQLQFFERDCTFAEVLRNLIETRVHDLILFSLGRSCRTIYTEHFVVQSSANIRRPFRTYQIVCLPRYSYRSTCLFIANICTSYLNRRTFISVKQSC